ncbi:CaiF/GrlA family transcriptional regulator [Salmonella enterica]|nr:CaiF/GrlA family transcriptional regulator [Salmonella enterica]EJC0345941.1 CaiF/GrlA family transcriptional regulator [Salmonella enterica]EJC0669249.1 CaiF/GrlA family transcriptional regulator [Salmonella enterica]
MPPDNTHPGKHYIVPDNDIHTPAQSNHDAFFIPESVRQYAGEPLYIIVAHWCVQQQDWVRHNQISEAFHITTRRTSFLISYLRNKKTRVTCVCRHQTLPNKARHYEVYVVRVLENPSQTRREKPPSPTVSQRRTGNVSAPKRSKILALTNADKAQANDLWNRLCRNRNAGTILKKEKDDDGI